MRRRRFQVPLLPALLLLLPLPATSGAEGEAGEPIKAPFVERTTTELILIEVYVTDSKGRPVRGLTIEDFVLKVDRRRQPIESVEFLEIAAPASPPTTPAEPAPVVEPPGVPSSPGIPRRFVLFFEDRISDFTAQTKARRAVETFLTTSLLPEDQVAIVADNARDKFHVVHDFSTNRESLAAAVHETIDNRNRFSDFPTEAEARRREIRLAGSGVPLMKDGGGRFAAASDAMRLARNFAREDTLLMRPILASMRTLIDSLSAWPGYKAIVFVGEGIPEYPARDYSRFAGQGVIIDDRYTLSVELMALARAAATSGVTLHSIQTSGLTAGGPGQLSRSFRRQNALKMLALNTAGVATTSNDLLEGFHMVDTISRAYYVLAYAPEGPPDGVYRGVTVKVKQGGVRVRHRDGFLRLPPDEAHQRSVQAAHLLPQFYPQAGLELSAVPGPLTASGRVHDLVVYFPARSTVFVPEEGRWTSRFEVGLVAVDGTGKETYRTARDIRILLPSDVSPGGDLGINLFARVPLPARPQTITAVLSDRRGGILGAMRLSYNPEKDAGGTVTGLSIYSLDQRSLWIDIDAPGERGEDREKEIHAYESGPAFRTRFAPGEPVACGFKLPGGGPADGRSLELVILKGEEIVRSKSLGRQEGGATGTVKVTLPVQGLANGHYILLVREKSDSGHREHGRLAFRIGPDDRADLR